MAFASTEICIDRKARQIAQEAQVSHELALESLRRAQEESHHLIRADLAKLSKRLGIEEASEASTASVYSAHEVVALDLPRLIQERLDHAFRVALPKLSDPKDLQLKDGVNGMAFHLERSRDITPPVDLEGTDPAIQNYLNLMKALYLLSRIQESKEYASKIEGNGDLLWAGFLGDLEDVFPCKS